MKRWIFSLLLLILMTTSPVNAVEDWEISNFDVEVEVDEDGWVYVVEVIKADFGDLEKHGIYRDIPIEYQDEFYNKLKLEYEVLKVSDDLGNERQFDEYKSGENLRVKIGDPLKTINGEQVYLISYKVKNAINFFETHDELYWNVNGNGWPVPIENISVKLSSDGDIDQIKCFKGGYGDASEDCEVVNGEYGEVLASNLEPYEGLTVVSAFPVGTVTKPTIWELLWNRLIANWGYFIPVITLLILLKLYFKQGRDEYYRHSYTDQGDNAVIPMFANSVVADRYYPPDDLTAAEAGVLIDEVAQSRDIASVLISLAELGHINITETAKGKYTFKKMAPKGSRSLRKYEQTMLDGIFKKADEVRLSSLKYKFASTSAKVTNQLYEYVVNQKLFHKRPDHIRNAYIAIGVVVIVLGFFGIIRGINSISGISVGVGIILSGIMIMLFSKSMPKRTAKGRRAMLDSLGLKRVIKLGDYRQQFFEEENYFTKILPYAIAFGLTKQWAKTLEKLNVKQPDWYQGHAPFSANTFAKSMKSFSKTSSSNLTSVKSSSKGSSGFSSSGGYSGGGFGGGGGGSW